MNDVDHHAWLADVLARLPDQAASKVADPASVELEIGATAARWQPDTRHPIVSLN
jgi:hypothetical protein